MDDLHADAPPGLNLADPEVAARWAVAEAPAGRIRLALAQGQVELARRVLADAEIEVRRLGSHDRLETTPLAMVDGLPKRLLELLEREADIVTVGDLLGVRRETLAGLPNMADRSVADLLVVLLRHTVKACRVAEHALAGLRSAQGGGP